jgi:hypothetical protein
MGMDMARRWSKDLPGWARAVVVRVMAILKCACRQMGMRFAVVAAARGCLRMAVVVEAVDQDPVGGDHTLRTLVSTDGDSTSHGLMPFVVVDLQLLRLQ